MPALARLNGLAGDVSLAAGRPAGARWLWRLALHRYASAGELASAEARAVSERLRVNDH
jgi:hypothetical protein